MLCLRVDHAGVVLHDLGLLHGPLPQLLEGRAGAHRQTGVREGPAAQESTAISHSLILCLWGTNE